MTYAASVAAAPVIREPLHAPVAHLVRGGVVEGIHYGSVVVLAADGGVDLQIGDIEAAFYPRSALKPVQAVAMLRAGLPLDGELLSLAAASHSGEERHLAGTRRILELAAVTEDDLRNVPDLPYDPVVRDVWIREGRLPSRLAQNCSGKHAAMLMTARLNGWSLDDYLDPGHPLQQAIAEIVEDLTGQAIAQVTVDGCGAPLFSVSLHGLARAAARITTAPAGDPRGAGRRCDARARRDGVRLRPRCRGADAGRAGAAHEGRLRGRPDGRAARRPRRRREDRRRGRPGARSGGRGGARACGGRPGVACGVRLRAAARGRCRCGRAAPGPGA